MEIKNLSPRPIPKENITTQGLTLDPKLALCLMFTRFTAEKAPLPVFQVELQLWLDDEWIPGRLSFDLVHFLLGNALLDENFVSLRTLYGITNYWDPDANFPPDTALTVLLTPSTFVEFRREGESAIATIKFQYGDHRYVSSRTLERRLREAIILDRTTAQADKAAGATA